MICPKCERETLKKICFKKDNNLAYFCELCSMMWLMDEEINVHTGHTIQSYGKDKDLEYTFDEIIGADPDTKPVIYPYEQK
jgi:hypothetical protein